jgi:hypothetical protein
MGYAFLKRGIRAAGARNAETSKDSKQADINQTLRAESLYRTLPSPNPSPSDSPLRSTRENCAIFLQYKRFQKFILIMKELEGTWRLVTLYSQAL